MKIKGQGFSVLGMGKTGISVARALACLGADVLLSDDRNELELRGCVSQLDQSVSVKFDGLAIRQGDVVVVSPGLSFDSDAFRLAQRLATEVISDMELFYRLWAGRIVAVTGTDGKSTVTALIAHILNYLGQNAFAVGNIGTPVMDLICSEDNHSNSIAVVEISSAHLVTSPKFRAQVAIVTNIAEDHIGVHGSFEAYINAKKRLLENQMKGDFFVRNLDDPVILEEFRPKQGQGVIDVSMDEGRVEKGIVIRDGIVGLKTGDDIQPLMNRRDFPLLGVHNTYNLMVALGAVVALGLDITDIDKAAGTFTGLEHRLEFVREYKGIRFINDSKATNPHAAIAGLKAIDGPVIAIVGGYDKGLDLREFANTLINRTKAVILTGPGGQRLFGMLSVGIRRLFASDLDDAVQKALSLATEGDTVVLEPGFSSFDAYANFEERGRHFKEIVNNLD